MYIKVRVTANAKRESVLETATNHFAISVTEPATENLANRRIIEIISDKYRVPARLIRILTGHRSQSKILSIED